MPDLLAEEAVVGSVDGEQVADPFFDGPIDGRHRSAVVLGLDAQCVAPEMVRRDLVRRVSEQVGEREIGRHDGRA